MTQTQLIFNFQTASTKEQFYKEDFIFSAENENAINFLNGFFAQKLDDINTVRSAILKGESQSGKSHLLHIFSQKFGAEFLQESNFNTHNWPAFFKQNNFYILENIEKITSEETLLHIINSASEAKAFLILSAQNIEKFTLRDLVSRLQNIAIVQIEKPQKNLIKILLAQGLSKKQLKVNDDVIEFLASCLKPSYSTIYEALTAIEKHCHSTRKNFTIAEAKKLI